ncbi:hypothetical protein FXO38_16405 [Capsicum annuum]|nr:hypothetical protein FXO38_16405 [Capsicum annuum]KAF3655300.1 hypothetical protein FXO37_15999 [Capsicum annuum]
MLLAKKRAIGALKLLLCAGFREGPHHKGVLYAVLPCISVRGCFLDPILDESEIVFLYNVSSRKKANDIPSIIILDNSPEQKRMAEIAMAINVANKLASILLPMMSVTRRMMVPLPEAESDGNDQEEKAKRDERMVENIMKAAEIHLVVAALLMTVTFTAGFTLPGGFESDTNSPNKGMPILLRRAAFRAFVISDVIAFTCSTAAVFAYFLMATKSISSARTELKAIIRLYNMAILLQLLAMTAVVIAFSTGLYVTLAHSVGLSVTVCVISAISFYMVCYMILLPEN